MRLLIRLVSLLLLLTARPLAARVVRVEIASRQDVLNGKIFGEAGTYERITGRIYFSLPVANPHNQRIADLNNAVNLKNGEVEFSANFMALRPKDAKKGNGSLLLEVPNRGHSRIVAVVESEQMVKSKRNQIGKSADAEQDGVAARREPWLAVGRIRR
jgi:hypothetical protein